MEANELDETGRDILLLNHQLLALHLEFTDAVLNCHEKGKRFNQEK
jgi:hypothetical protein